MASVFVYKDGVRTPIDVDGRTYRELTGMPAPGVVGADAWRDMVMMSVSPVQVGSSGMGGGGRGSGGLMLGGVPGVGGAGDSGSGWTPPSGSGGGGVDYDRVAGTAGDVDFGANNPSAVDLGWISQAFADKVPNFFMYLMSIFAPEVVLPYKMAQKAGAFSQGVPTGMQGGIPAAQAAYHEHAMNEIATENQAAVQSKAEFAKYVQALAAKELASQMGVAGEVTGMQGGIGAAQAASQAHAVNEAAASQGWVPPVAQVIDPFSYAVLEGTRGIYGGGGYSGYGGGISEGLPGFGDMGYGGAGVGFGYGGDDPSLYGGMGGE